VSKRVDLSVADAYANLGCGTGRRDATTMGRATDIKEAVMRGGVIQKKQSVTLYELLGITPGADAVEVRRGYRQSVRLCHPDLYPDDPTATARFIHLKKAYDLLSDDHARARYDARLARETERRATPLRTWFAAWSTAGAGSTPLQTLGEHQRMALAGSLKDTAALERLLADPSPAVAACVLDNQWAGPALLARGAVHPHWSVRRAAAARPECPLPALQRLSGDRERLVRLAVARNPAATESVLAGVRHHDDHDGAIALALARHPRTPDRMLANLAAQATEPVEAALVERVPPSRPALEVLATRPGGTRTVTAQALVAALDLVASLGMQQAQALWAESVDRAHQAQFWPPALPVQFEECLGPARSMRLRGRLNMALATLALGLTREGET
jgi:hypothetical protein